MNEGNYESGVLNSQPIFDPTYLNIEFFFNKILELFTQLRDIVFGSSSFTHMLPYVKTFLSVLAILFITGIIYSLVRIREIRKEETAEMHFAEPIHDEKSEKRERWEVIENHINSVNPSDWRLAIIEADSLLDEMVKRMGYQGESLGERLKAVEVSDFNSIQNAWEAHKVRNKIAHDGSGFSIDHREAKRVIELYEQVFKEFEYL